MWELIGDGVRPEKNGDTSFIAITPTPTPNPLSMLLVLVLVLVLYNTLTPTWQTNKAFNGRRHKDKYVYVSMDVLSYTQYTYNFSHKINLFS